MIWGMLYASASVNLICTQMSQYHSIFKNKVFYSKYMIKYFHLSHNLSSFICYTCMFHSKLTKTLIIVTYSLKNESEVKENRYTFKGGNSDSFCLLSEKGPIPWGAYSFIWSRFLFRRGLASGTRKLIGNHKIVSLATKNVKP